MMRIAIISDVHIGNHQRHGGKAEAGINKRCSIVLDVLYNACDLICKEECDVLIVAGDLCHSDKISPQIITEIQNIIPPEDVETYLVAGNHDQTSFDADDHALGPQTDCHVIDSIAYKSWKDFYTIFIPYRSGKVEEWLPKELDKYAGKSSKTTVLVAHFGISDSTTPPYLVQQPDTISIDNLINICNHYKIKYVFVGHWHNRKTWTKDGMTVIQLGALCPTGWKDPGLEGYGVVTILDEKGITEHEIPGPRFVSIHHAAWCADYQRDFKKVRDKGGLVYLEMITKPSRVLELYRQLQKAVERGLYAAVDVHPSFEETAEAARKAAVATTKTDTLLEALTTFVETYPLKHENVGRVEILEETKNYLDM